MSDEVDAAAAVTAFFDAFTGVTPIGLILPDGWFGRPWDEILTLLSVESGKDDTLVVDLGWKTSLSAQSVSATMSSDLSELRLTGKDLAFRSGTQKRAFDTGIARFVVSPDDAVRIDAHSRQLLARWVAL